MNENKINDFIDDNEFIEEQSVMEGPSGLISLSYLYKDIKLDMTPSRTKQRQDIEQRLTKPHAKLLLMGAPGVGKSRLMFDLAHHFEKPVFSLDLLTLSDISQGSALAFIDAMNLVSSNDGVVVIDRISDVITGQFGQVLQNAVVNMLSSDDGPRVIMLATPAEARFITTDQRIAARIHTIVIPELSIDESQNLLTSYGMSNNSARYVTNNSHLINRHQARPGSLFTLLNEFDSLTDAAKSDVETIKKVIAKRLNMPMLSSDKELAAKLLVTVHGQDKAVSALANAVNSGSLRLSNQNKPLASMLFYGPSGTGKTFTAKQLAHELFGDANRLIKINGGEFKSKYDLTRIVGASAGLIGSDSKAPLQMTDDLIINPHSVVLIDEVEKMDENVMDLFLSALDDGYYKDASGRRIDTTNAIFIFTSNKGAEKLSNQSGIGFGTQSAASARDLKKALNSYFKPEILNRFTALVGFEPSTLDDLVKMLDDQLAELKKDVYERFDFEFVINRAELIEKLKIQMDPNQNGRIVERLIEHDVVPEIEKQILA